MRAFSLAVVKHLFKTVLSWVYFAKSQKVCSLAWCPKAKSISGAVKNAKVQASHWQQEKGRSWCCTKKFLVDMTSVFFKMAPPPSSRRWMTWILLYLEAGHQGNDKWRKWDQLMIRMQSKCSLAVCHVCSCEFFCPCLSQQSGLIYQCHSRGLNNKVQCVKCIRCHCLCISHF